MIALGGTIGTGVFLGSGPAIHTAGPGGVLVAYGIIGIMVYFVMTGLGNWQPLCQQAVRLVLMPHVLLTRHLDLHLAGTTGCHGR